MTAGLLRNPRQVAQVVTREVDELAERGIRLPYRGDQLPLVPTVAPAAWPEILSTGCRAVFDGIEAVFHGAFESDTQRLADFLRFNEAERRLLSTELHAADWAVAARPDFMADGDRLAMIETNISTSLGLLDAGLIGRVLEQIPSIRQGVIEAGLTTIDPARRLVETVARHLHFEPAFLVLADWPGEWEEWAFVYEYLVQEFTSVGIYAVSAYLDDLEVRDSGVYLDGRKVDMVYRFFTTTVLDDAAMAARHSPLLRATRDGRVRLFGDYSHKMFTPKLFLALLSDENYSDMVSSRIRRAVDIVVPWTRLLEDRTTLFNGRRVDLVPFVGAHRERFVLKPNLGYGGRGVVVGDSVTDVEWSDYLATALTSDEHWLVQTMAKGEDVEIAFLDGEDVAIHRRKVDYGVFMFERSFAGAARRNATTSTGPTLTNLTRGGGLGPVYYLPR